MRRMLPAAEFVPWLKRFPPDLTRGKPASLFRPATASDRGDGRIGHLDGLGLSHACCWRLLAGALAAADPRRARAEAAARARLAASLPATADD